MADNRVRWGVISTANIGRGAVIPAIQASRNGDVVAVASRERGKAESFAARLGIPHYHGSYEELLQNPEVDAVYIPLPNSLHKEWVIRSAQAGKHVLCEKPLGLNAAECLEMKAAADAAGVKLMEAFMYRFHPRTEQVIARVQGGGLGKLTNIDASFTFRLTNLGNIRYNPDLGGGSLMDVGCYCVNLIRTLAGTQPVEVSAFANWAETGVDQQMVGMLRFESGLLGHFDSSIFSERRESYTVAGTDGYLQVPSAFLPGKDESQVLEFRGRGERAVHTFAGVDEYQRMVEHFADCVLTGAEPRYSALEAADNMRVITALYRSAHEGGWVKLSDIE